jgi:hypothetical protein
LLYVSAAHPFDPEGMLGFVQRWASTHGTGATEVFALVDQSAAGSVGENPAWVGSMLCRIKQGSVLPIRLLPDMPGEATTNMGDPSMVADLVRLGLSTRPERRLALIVMGHGNGCQGLCADVTGEPVRGGAHNTRALGFRDLRTGIRRGLGTRRRALDLLILASCTSGCIEGMYDLHGCAQWCVASECLTRMNGLDVESLIGAFDRSASLTAEEVARTVVLTHRFHPECDSKLVPAPEWEHTVALLDLQAVPNCVHALRRLADACMLALRADEVGARRELRRAWRSSCSVVCRKPRGDADLCSYADAGHCCMRDLRMFAEALTSSTHPAVQGAAARLLDAHARVVLLQRSCPDTWCYGRRHGGLSIFSGCNPRQIRKYSDVGHIGRTGWDALLLACFESGCAGDGDPLHPRCVSPPETEVMSDGQIRVTAQLHADCARLSPRAALVVRTPDTRALLLRVPVHLSPSDVENRTLTTVWDGRVPVVAVDRVKMPIPTSLSTPDPHLAAADSGTGHLNWGRGNLPVRTVEVLLELRVVNGGGPPQLGTLINVSTDSWGLGVTQVQQGDVLEPSADVAAWWRQVQDLDPLVPISLVVPKGGISVRWDRLRPGTQVVLAIEFENDDGEEVVFRPESVMVPPGE